MKTLLIFSVVLSLMGCNGKNQATDGNIGRLKEALIIGSAESPDPVLQRVQALERNRKRCNGFGVISTTDPLDGVSRCYRGTQ